MMRLFRRLFCKRTPNAIDTLAEIQRVTDSLIANTNAKLTRNQEGN